MCIVLYYDESALRLRDFMHGEITDSCTSKLRAFLRCFAPTETARYVRFSKASIIAHVTCRAAAHVTSPHSDSR